MRTRSLTAAVLAVFVMMATTASTQGAYQLPNAGFEQWDGGNTSEPTHWNTFSSSDGSFASLVSDNHHYRRAGHRPDGSGSYYLTIYTKSILGIKANGNMTTGRIHAGAMSATSSDNYNYTQRSNADHCQPFTATPDSMYVWVSYYAKDASSVAHIAAIIHGDNDFKAPNEENDASKYCAKAIASTHRTTSSPSSMQWQQMKVPFVYNGTTDPRYILINIASNSIPGGGDKYDSLSVDDIEFVYSSWLTDLALRGTSVEGFSKGKMDYTIKVDNLESLTASDISTTTEVSDASAEVTLTHRDDTTARFTITVTAEDGSQRAYTILAYSGQEPVGFSPIPSTKEPLFFPNPASDHITINISGSLTITDMHGRTVMQKEVRSGETISIGHLPKGTYLISIDPCNNPRQRDLHEQLIVRQES